MKVEDIENMSSTEFRGWEEYFSIFPFTVDRMEMQNASELTYIGNLLKILINSFVGKKALDMSSMEEFMPNYIEPVRKVKSLERQKEEALLFVSRYNLAKNKRIQ